MSRPLSIVFPWRSPLRLAAAVMLVVLSLPVVSNATSPRRLDLNYCWGTGWPSFSACPQASLTLYSNHSVVAVDQASGATGIGQWTSGRHGHSLTIAFTFPGATYAGTQTTSNCYQGTMTSPNIYGGGTWAGCFVH